MSTTEQTITRSWFARTRELARRITESPAFQSFIVAVIVVNAITLGLETTRAGDGNLSPFLHLVDRVALAIFVVELSLKLLAQGRRFFASGWNVFDLCIVAISFFPAAGGLSVLRVLRVLRVTRLFSVVPSMRVIVEALVGAIPGMTSIMLVLGLIFYISAVLTTRLFGDHFPSQFGDLGVSSLTLFQLMTLDGWSGEIVRPVMERYPWSWVFFISFIIITSFAVLNLFIGVLMSNIEAQQEEREVQRDQSLQLTVERIAKEVSELRALLSESGRSGPPHD